ncbi:response regulator [Sandaracinus amylolyticus]|uniref:response regulator n=1 Tax=Sandaracinus amylolyticus TaxID=927083 RepID=UPI001F41EF6A|nr:response regulator [Sandaracinus amylolyticus]UJR82906.1 Hypothetical protein I5071_49710 [Sandaracinus amylolyticus]
MLPTDDRGTLRVLLVDDNVTLASLLGRVLEETGCAVTTAVSADVAKALIEAGDFDLLVCDATLVADGDGRDVLAFARERAPRALRVLFSGRPPDDTDSTLIERFAMKPMLSEELRDLVRWARHSARRPS